ncbi:MAG TPA: ABC transporter substrate-binding protein [Methylomirabilota bacterium]|jgi:peptide/nickel transport system substrate-binding protein
MKRSLGRISLVLATWLVIAVTPARAEAPAGQVTWGVSVSLPPAWFDPADATGILIPFMVYYALHDALVKPMPGNPMAPCLAESWSVSADGLAYEFVLRREVKFHNGDPVTADDVKFSFERYRGVSAKILKERVKQVQVVDPHRVRFQLKEPWPDFLTFYATPATGAAWIVPRRYIEKVGDEGFKKAPVGAGPYRFVSFTPGVELIVEANERYWRKTPSVKRLVLKAVSDDVTRATMLKRGEIDIGYIFRGAVAEDIRRTGGLTLKPVRFYGEQWLLFTDQWDPKSPWADRRVRLAVNHGIDRQAINESLTLGFSRMTGGIIPRDFEFSWPAPPYPYDAAKARQLLTEAGYAKGLEAELWTDTGFAEQTEAIANYLGAIGIRTRMRTLERAAYFSQLRDKKLRPLVYVASAAYGNAATRLDSFVSAGGVFTYGSYPDIEGLIQEQATERDRKRREETLHRIQQLMYERVMFAPVWDIASLHGYGPRVAEPGFGLIGSYLWSGPYEDVRLKRQ